MTFFNRKNIAHKRHYGRLAIMSELFPLLWRWSLLETLFTRNWLLIYTTRHCSATMGVLRCKKKWMWQIWFTEAVWRRRCLDSSVAKDVRYNKCKAVSADVVVWWKTGLREASTNQPPSVKVQGLWEYFKTPVRVPTGEQAARNGAGSTIDTARLAWHPVFTVYRLDDWLTAIKASAQKYCLSCSSC